MATANLQTTAEESTQALSVTFGQVQELLDTNKETNKALNQLIISVKDLMKDTSRNSVYPNASKPDVNIDGAVAEAPTPQGIGEWTKVEVMSLDEVIAEDEKAKQNYHGKILYILWKVLIFV